MQKRESGTNIRAIFISEQHRKEAKRLKATTLAIGRAKTKWGAIVNNKQFYSAPKIILHYGGTNIIFANYADLCRFT